jgi:acetyltransferase-like isoleucine patch superfamily enzyme
VTIGKNTVIGAFSFVNTDIPENTIAYGVPAKIKRKLTKKETEKVQETLL